jgi:hypothetical protein
VVFVVILGASVALFWVSSSAMQKNSNAQV